MTKGQKIVVALVGLLVLGWIGGLGDSPEPAAPAQTAPEQKPEVKVPNDLGDDPALDALWFACASGDEDACYDLWWEAPTGSEYERFADERIEEIEAADAQDASDRLAEIVLRMVWDGMDQDGRDELCDGFVILGALEASQIVAESSGGTVTPEQVAAFFTEVCRG